MKPTSATLCRFAACLCIVSGALSASAGSLSGSFTTLPPGANIDLTAEGIVDWAHWGRLAPDEFNHRAGIPQQISNFTLIAGEGVEVEQFGDNATGYSWSNGTPLAAANNQTAGIYVVGVDNGFEVSVPADTTVRTLKLYVGAYAARMSFEAALSDNSAPAYVETGFANESDGPNAVFTIGFAAGSAGQRLVARLIVAEELGGFANVTLQAAVLREAAPLIELAKPADGAIFYPSADGLEFSASTLAPNSIATDQVRLLLNGQDVSGGLTLTGTPLSRTATFNQLAPNVLYDGLIVVADDLGRAATNSFRFDTFTLSGTVLIEAEDYNYSDGICDDDSITTPPTLGGRFQDNPPASGFDEDGNPVGGLQPNGTRLGYQGAVGMPGVDFSDHGDSLGDYRLCDPVGTRLSPDLPRARHVSAGVEDYDVGGIDAGEWLNYTRTFAGSYNIYLRAAAVAEQSVRLERVTSDPTKPNQNTEVVGSFALPRSGLLIALRYVPLTDAFGKPAVLTLNGAQTFRCVAPNADDDLILNYIVFAPATSTGSELPSVIFASPAPDASGVAPDAELDIGIADGAQPVVVSSVRLRLDGADVTTSATVSDTITGVRVQYSVPSRFESGSLHSVSIDYGDGASAPQTAQWSFTVANLPLLSASLATPLGSGTTKGFAIRIHHAADGSDPAVFTNSSARAELQLAGGLIDPSTGTPFVNEAAGTNGDGRYDEDNVVNYEQDGLPIGYFADDTAFPGVSQGQPDFMAMEVTAYLELRAGIHRFGVRSDDGFRLTAGRSFADANILLSAFEGGRASTLPDGSTESEFLVEQDGVYPFRLLWYEGTGGAAIEWFSVDRATLGSPNVIRTLINDAAANAAVKAFRERTGSPPPAQPLLTNPTLSATEFSVSFQSEAGLSYTLQSKETVDGATWQSLPPAVSGDGTVKTITRPYSSSTGYFRLLVQ